MKTRLTIDILTRSLIYLCAAIWFGFAVVYTLNLHPALPEGDTIRFGMAALALLTSVTLVVLMQLSIQWRVPYFMLLGLLVLISFLTIMDEFGLVDLAVLLVHLLALLLLIVDRERYLFQNVDSRSA